MLFFQATEKEKRNSISMRGTEKLQKVIYHHRQKYMYRGMLYYRGGLA
jgi:hypothetical protein